MDKDQDTIGAHALDDDHDQAMEAEPQRYGKLADCVMPALSVVAVGFWGELVRNGGDIVTQLRLDWGGW